MGKASCTSHKKSNTADFYLAALGKGYGTNQSNAMYLKYPNVNMIIYFQRSRRKLTVKSIKPSPTTEQNAHAIPETARERSILKTPFTTLINYSNTQTNFFFSGISSPCFCHFFSLQLKLSCYQSTSSASASLTPLISCLYCVLTFSVNPQWDFPDSQCYYSLS